MKLHRSNLDALIKPFGNLIGKVYGRYEGLIYLVIAVEVWRQFLAPHLPSAFSLPVLILILVESNFIKLPGKNRLSIFKEVLKQHLE
jgi:hypothetical protein